MIITNTTEGVTEVNFTYDGKKLVKEVASGTGYLNYTKNYYYTGNLITKYEKIYGKDNSTVTDLIYENNKLKTLFEKKINLKAGTFFLTKKTYIHNLDGTVSFVIASIDKDTNEETSVTNGKLIYVNDAIVKDERFDDPTGIKFTAIEYDTKNNPFKNVIGANLLLAYSDFNWLPHNKTKSTVKSIYNFSSSYSATYNYDKNDFPVVGIYVDETGNAYGKTEYFY
ncbi:hypothetical protein B0A81_17710 [Flavobacterium plurextorum]|uniref:RHS repeat-associated core domain-containing protein n=2 Tax=Flavobacteriaceae TaxID=49546 RepID=A0ABX4CQ73_9FLAO|nr:hypothetical protein B0A81_17710 [Flavobacterium plurextorum]